MWTPLLGAPGGDGSERHEKVTVDANKRMWLNGETPGQMNFAYEVKKAGGVTLEPNAEQDTSRDSEFPIDTSAGAKAKDMYILITTALFLVPKILVLAIPMLFFNLFPLLLARIYVSVLPDKTERVHRSLGFYVIFVIAFSMSIPAICLICVSLLLDYIAYYFFGILFCAFTCRWSNVCRNMEKIKPFRGGPGVISHAPDLFVCIIGQCGRQTAGETWYMVSCMWLLMPWLKYHINCNPWVYDLDHRLCQQISTEMRDLGTPDDCADSARRIISRSRHDRSMAERIDIWSFVPHYPYPPLDRRWALGLQAGGAKYPGKFTLIVHTTHAISDAGNSTEQFVLSNSCKRPIYRVMLWYSNPFHFLTGWVEASVSTGQYSQPDKDGGGEHPMWLCTTNTPVVGGRDGFTGSGMIDAFFDYWLPVFVHEMRYSTMFHRFQDEPDAHEKALKIAEDKYEEVHSDDIVSRPIGKKGRLQYGKKDALSDMLTVAESQNKASSQALTRKVAGLAETAMGKKMANQLQSSDLHDRGGLLEGASA